MLGKEILYKIEYPAGEAIGLSSVRVPCLGKLDDLGDSSTRLGEGNRFLIEYPSGEVINDTYDPSTP